MLYYGGGGGWFNQAPVIPSRTLKFISSWLNTFPIFSFTFISGYLFYYLKFEIKKYNNLFKDSGKRAKRLLLPYLVVSLIWVIPFYIYFFGFDITTILKKYLLAISPSQLWFLWMIFVLFVIFYLLSDIMNKISLWIGLMTAIAFYGVSIIGGHFLPNIFQIWTTCAYFLFYYLGFAMRKYSLKWLYKIPWVIYVILNVGLFCLYYFYLAAQTSFILKVICIGIQILIQVSGVLMVVIGFSKLNLEKLSNNKLYRFLEKYNFGMYLFHQQLIYITITIFNGAVPNIILVLLNFIFASVLSALISYILSTWKVSRMLIGIK